MNKFALLLRLNPLHWPEWENTLAVDRVADIWFRTGRRRPEDILPGIPVVVLGTGGLGVVAWGETSTSVEFRPDPDWQESPPEHQVENMEPANRVCVKIRRVGIPLSAVQTMRSIANLSKTARETATWLTQGQYQEFAGLLGGGQGKPAASPLRQVTEVPASDSNDMTI